MNRQEKRKKERLQAKSDAKLQSILKDRKIGEAFAEVVEIEANKKMDRLTNALDCCFSAAMYLNTDKSKEEVGDIFEKVFLLMNEYVECEKKLKDKFKGDFKMAIKKLSDEVKTECIRLIEEGVTQKVAVKELRSLFKDLSTAEVTNAYRNTKAETKGDKKEISEVEAAQKLNDILAGAPVKKAREVEVKESVPEVEIIEEVKEPIVVAKEILPTAQIRGEVKAPGLKVKIRKMEVEGENGFYMVEDGKVRLGSNTWENENDFNKWAMEIKEVFKLAK